MIISKELLNNNQSNTIILNKYSKNFFLNTGIDQLTCIIYSIPNTVRIFSSDHKLIDLFIKNDVFTSYQNINRIFLAARRKLNISFNHSYIFDPQNIHLYSLIRTKRISTYLKITRALRNINFQKSLSAVRKQNNHITTYLFSSLLENPYMHHINNIAIINSFIKQFENDNFVLLNNLMTLEVNYSQKDTEELTTREFECLIELSKQKTSKEIALFLNISYRTVENHIHNLKKKLRVYSKAQLIRYCQKINFLQN